MALSSISRLGLDIYIEGDAPRVAKDLSTQLHQVVKRHDELRARLIKQKEEYARLKVAASDAIRAERVGLLQLAEAKKQHIRLTQQALSETKISTVQIKTALRSQIEHTNLLAQAWSKFGVIFTRVLDALVAFVIIDTINQSIRFMIESLIKSGQLFDTLNARLSVLIPNVNELAKISKILSEITITTPFVFDEVVNAAILLRTYGIDIEKNFKAVADWAAATDRDLKDTAISFGKIISFSPRTQLMLTTRGLTLEAFETYVARFGNRAEALQRLIEDTFGTAAARISSTFEGILTNINDVWLLLSEAVGRDAFHQMKVEAEGLFQVMRALVDNAFVLRDILNISMLGFQEQVAHFLSLYEFVRQILVKFGIPAPNLYKAIAENLEKDLMAAKTPAQRIAAYERAKTVSELMGFPQAIPIYNKLIELEKESLSIEQRKLLMINAQVDALTSYEIQQKIQQTGLTDIVLKMARIADYQAKIAKSVDESTFYRAEATFLRGLAESPNLEKARQKMEELLTGLVKMRGETNQEFFQRRQAITETLLMYIELIDKQKKSNAETAKARDYYEQYIRKLIDVKNAVSDLFLEIAKRRNAILGGGQEQLRNILEGIIGTPTVNGVPVESAYKEIQRLIEQKTSGIASATLLGATTNYKAEYDILVLRQKQIALLKDAINIIEELGRVSNNFGDAFSRAFRSSRQQLENWRQELAEAIIELGRGFIKSIFHEMLFGTKAHELDDKILDLRFKLIQIQAEKQNISDEAKKILIIEDEEINALARINQLESERKNIVFAIFKDAFEKFMDRLETLGVDTLFDLIIPRDDTQLNKLQQVTDLLLKISLTVGSSSVLELEQQISDLKVNAAGELIALDTIDLGLVQQRLAGEREIAALKTGQNIENILNIFGNGIKSPPPQPVIPQNIPRARPIININGPLYGFDDFSRKIDQSLKEIDRSIR